MMGIENDGRQPLEVRGRTVDEIQELAACGVEPFLPADGRELEAQLGEFALAVRPALG